VLNRTGSRIGGLDPESVAAGVEEEFHTVDLATQRLTPRADSLVEQLPAAGFSSELQRPVLGANSRPHVRLADLAVDIAALAGDSSAARQRAACARSGLQNVVDTLLTETRTGTGCCRARDPPARRSARCCRATRPRRRSGPLRPRRPRTVPNDPARAGGSPPGGVRH